MSATPLRCVSLQQGIWLNWFCYVCVKSMLVNTCVSLWLSCYPAAITSLFMEDFLILVLAGVSMHVVSVNFWFTQQMCNRWFSPVYQSYCNFQLDSVQLQTDSRLIAVTLVHQDRNLTLKIAQIANSCSLQSSHCEGSRFTAHDPINFGFAKVCNHCSP